MPDKKLSRLTPTLLLLALLLTGCATSLPVLVSPPAIPPLPVEARQPAIPSECSGDCLQRLMSLRESWLSTLDRLE